MIIAINRSLFIASVILLPLLGLTWIFGILAINSNTTVFAWFFTLFNSIQVRCIAIDIREHIFPAKITNHSR